MATRRSKRIHDDNAPMDAHSLSHSSSHVDVVKSKSSITSLGLGVGRRPVLKDLTNKEETTTAAAKGKGKEKEKEKEKDATQKPITTQSSTSTTRGAEEETHVQTRAQSRSHQTQQQQSVQAHPHQPSKKAKLTTTTTRTTRATAQTIAPIQLKEEEEIEEADEEEEDEADEPCDEEDAEMHDAEDNTSMDEDAHLRSNKSTATAAAASSSSAMSSSSTSVAETHTATAVTAAAASASSSTNTLTSTLPIEDQPSWQQCLDDPCQEYADSIYQHLRTTEMVLHPNPLYMDKVQGDLTHAMRSILVDWMVEVAQEYSLKSQTLFLAVSYLDRFLSTVQVDRSRLQLVGVTAMLVAAKYWEIWPPAIEEFVYISDKTYSKEEVLAMENTILTCLKFKLTSPTSWEFSRRFCRSANADKRTEMLVDYMLELILQEAPSLTFRPSIIAASSLFLSLYTLNLPPWSERLEVNTGIRVEELQSCVRILHTIYVKTCLGQNSLRAVKEKYSQDNMLQVALIKPRAIN